MSVRRCALSGSYHRDPDGLQLLYEELVATNCQVLSPFSARFDNVSDQFVTTKHEKLITPAELERRHLAAIAHADFVWLHCPEGYVGLSGALELGFAYANNIPVFGKHKPAEPALDQFVSIFSSVFEALKHQKLL